MLRGTIVTFSIGSTCSDTQPTIAWPASWYAMRRFSACDITLCFFSMPHSTRSTAPITSSSSTFSWLLRMAMIAASFTMLQMSAPVYPGVISASFCAMSSRSPSISTFAR